MKLVRVNLPPYEEGCDADAAAVDCDYPPYALNKLISSKFAEAALVYADNPVALHLRAIDWSAGSARQWYACSTYCAWST